MAIKTVETIRESLNSGLAIPYLGAGVLALAGDGCPLPASPWDLVDRLTAKASVPHKIRRNLTAAAQFIENFKHRKTVKAAMTEAFGVDAEPTALHRYLASLPALRLIVHAWYDDLPQKALASRKGWGIVQGVSQAEHFGAWDHYFDGDTGAAQKEASDAASWMPVLYQPLGSVSPGGEFPRFGLRFRRGANRNRHSDAYSRGRSKSAQGPELPVSRLPFRDPAGTDIRAPNYQAVVRSPLGRTAGAAHAQRGALPRSAQYRAYRHASFQLHRAPDGGKRRLSKRSPASPPSSGADGIGTMMQFG